MNADTLPATDSKIAPVRTHFSTIKMMAVALVMLFVGMTASHAEEEEGKRVELTVILTNGSGYNIADQRGKLVLVAVWATWCPICLGELPDLEKIYAKNKNSGFEIIALNIDTNEQKLRDYLSKNHFSFPVARRRFNGNTDNLDAPPVTPVFYLVGKDGQVIWRKIGPVVQLLTN